MEFNSPGTRGRVVNRPAPRGYNPGNVKSVTRRQSSAGETQEDLVSLVERIAAGEDDALAELYDRTSRQVFGLALHILRDSAEAEEVTLDVYTQVWKQASRYDRARGSPSAWLLTMAHSRAIDRFRSRRSAGSAVTVELSELLPAGDDDPEAESFFSQRRRCVRKALRSLPPEQQEVILLAFFRGLTHTEIAEALKLPLGTAKSRIRLALLRLRDALKALEGGAA